jgi:hypothetical protein
MGPIVWFNKGNEPRCAGCDAQSEVADSDDGHECEGCNLVPPPPADALAPSVTENVLTGTVELPNNATLLDLMKKVEQTSTGRPVLSVEKWGPHGLIVTLQASDRCAPSCTDGCPILAAGEVPSSLAAPCCCEEPEDAPQAPAAEPPALLTLSQHKDPSAGLPASPQWQEELLKAFRGRRLSELFEPHAAPAPEGAPISELGRLLAEFPKHQTAVTGQSGSHGLTIVDMPDRVRIFETGVSHPEVDQVFEAAKSPAGHACPNCREEFRAFLEEMFRGSEATEDIAQTSHREGDHKASEAVRDLPNVTHSKIATESRCYPLRDLVLCDDAGRPVFDTCTIIDHLQSAVAPESWSHPSVSIQLDQQSVSLVVTQTAEVHQKIADHLRYLRRLQIKQICNLIERLSGDADESAESGVQTEASLPASEVELGPALPVGRK